MTARTIEIPPERWPSFLDLVKQQATGEPVRLEVANRELGDQEMSTLLALRDLDLETKGSERGRLIVAVASDRGELTHLVQAPLQIAAGLNEQAELQWLAIEESDAVTTIHFEHYPELESEYAAIP